MSVWTEISLENGSGDRYSFLVPEFFEVLWEFLSSELLSIFYGCWAFLVVVFLKNIMQKSIGHLRLFWIVSIVLLLRLINKMICKNVYKKETLLCVNDNFQWGYWKYACSKS